MKIFIIFLLLIIISCSQSKEIYDSKIDPLLIKTIVDAEQIKSEEMINFIGSCNSDITSSMKEDLEISGINIRSISKDIFTASGNYKSILKIAGKNYIKWLETPREVRPLNKN
jgi:hypothetical protein